MKPTTTITVKKKAMLDAVVSASKSTLSPSRCRDLNIDFIYSCIVFRMNDYFTLYAMASDTKKMISVPVEIINRKGDTISFALSSDDILPVIKRLDDQDLVIDIYENKVTFRHSYGTFTVPQETESLDAFFEKRKELEKLPTEYKLDIEASFFKSTLNCLQKYVAQDELRPVLNGICIHRNGGQIDFVASDGHKLIKITKPDTECTLSTKLLITDKDVKVLRRILPHTGIVHISYTGSTDKKDSIKPICRMYMDNKTEFWFTPNDGKFPNYSAVIPTKCKSEVKIHRNLLMNSLYRLSYFCPVTNIVRVAIQKGKAILSAEDKDFKINSSETLPCEQNGINVLFGLKIDNVTTLLKSLPAEELLMKFTGKVDNGIVVIPTNQPEGQEITTLFMPCLID